MLPYFFEKILDWLLLNTLRPRQNGRHFTDDTFKPIFLNEKIRISIKNFTEVCPYGSTEQYSSIRSDNGLVPTRRQAIIWTNLGLFTDAYMRHSASMS